MISKKSEGGVIVPDFGHTLSAVNRIFSMTASFRFVLTPPRVYR